MSGWLDLWPGWARRWYGWALRALVGIAGAVFGALLVFLAYFGAAYKQTKPEWGSEEVVILVSGFAVLVASIWVLAGPSKTSLTVLVTTVGCVFIGLQP